MFRTGDAAAAMLAGDEAALAVAGMAVGEIRRLAVDADRPGFLFPLEDAVVGNIAAQQIAPVAEPHRAFGPAQPGGQPFHRRQFQPVFLEARIERVDRRIGIMGRRPPAGACSLRDICCSRCLVWIPTFVTIAMLNGKQLRYNVGAMRFPSRSWAYWFAWFSRSDDLRFRESRHILRFKPQERIKCHAY